MSIKRHAICRAVSVYVKQQQSTANMRGKKVPRGGRGGRGKGNILTQTPPAPVEMEDSDSDSDSPPVAHASAQPTPSCKRKCEESIDTNPDKRQAFSEFIASSLRDIDERLWDTYTYEALKLVIDFKRRSRAAPTVPVAGDDQ